MTADRADSPFKDMPAEKIIAMLDGCLELLAIGMEMRVAQKRYFKDRSQEALVDSKQLERKFDERAVALAQLRHGSRT
jgi:hypothetical protein